MDKSDPDTPKVTENAADGNAEVSDEGSRSSTILDDRLAGPMQQWQALYLRQEDRSPESLGVEDPVLREALREWIKKQKRLYDFLKLPGLSTKDAADALDAAPAAEALGGAVTPQSIETTRKIGRYLVLESLGDGGEGQVSRVVHPLLGTKLVLKLARRSLAAAPDGPERLLRAGRLLASCVHPNLVKVVDVDLHGGRPFVVMEDVYGLDLEQYAHEHRPSPHQAARIVAELARAVAYIHSRGVLHLDIKPKNVLVDSESRPRLIDFGMARIRHAWSEGPAGASGGTTSFMSPEQAQGRDDRVGPCTDVFGLGGVLYFLLTGRPVYQPSSGLAALQEASRGDQVPPRQFSPRVPLALERICKKALAPDPERRYQSAEALARALRRFVWRPQFVAAGAVVLGTAAAAFLALGTPPERKEASVALSELHPLPVGPDSPAVALRIVSFKVSHFRGENSPKSLGTIGVSPEPVLFDDDVRIRAEISAPAYCYLIALNPNGKVQLCDPSKETVPPPRSHEFVFPIGKTDFALNDATGLQAFVLAASRVPLPPFTDWEGRRGLRWETVPADGAGPWSFDGQTFEPLSDDRRGELRKRSGEPRPFKEVCEYVAKLPGIDAVRAIVFPVVRQK